MTGPNEVEATETVLVAEDEESVRRLVGEILRRRGYTVLSAEDGDEALAVAEAHDGPIDVLVSDIIMPKVRGPALAERLRASRPDVKVLFISGYSESRDAKRALEMPDSRFLSKPFSPSRLWAEVRALLDGPDA